MESSVLHTRPRGMAVGATFALALAVVVVVVVAMCAPTDAGAYR